MDKKTEYLEDELWILAWNASVQRAYLYGPGASNKKKSIFKKKIKEYIRQSIIPQYKETVEAELHRKNIKDLIEHAEKVDNGIKVLEKGYKYGVAQKVLNLALKYYWCLGQIKEPPHCPVDRIIIDKTRFKGKINWTQMDEKVYLKIISDIREKAENENCSIAYWELNNYKRLRP